MADAQWSSPPREGESGNWKTPIRKIVRYISRKDASFAEIKAETGVLRSIARGILRQENSHRTRKGKKYQANLLSAHDIRQAIQIAIKNFQSRKLS
jgi:hypothetical protein